MSLTGMATPAPVRNVRMRIHLTAFLLLFCVFFPASSGVAATIVPIYNPEEETGRTGFFDVTPLTQEERNRIGPSGNDAETLGDARKKALEHALGLIADKLEGSVTVRVDVGFKNIDTTSSGSFILANAAPCLISSRRLPSEEALYPSALAKSLSAQIRGAGLCSWDIRIRFNNGPPFYYGFDEIPGNSRAGFNFVSVVMHEVFHGLGLFENVEDDGSWKSVDGRNNLGEPTSVQQPSVYDEQLYSEADENFFPELSDSQRAAAITSGDGLSWDGRTVGATRRSCSYGRLVGGIKTDGISSSGRPLLHAPSDYQNGSSISHFHVSVTPDDILEPRFPVLTRDMTLALALLKDMGWRVDDACIPASCNDAIPVNCASRPTTSEPDESPSPSPNEQPDERPSAMPPSGNIDSGGEDNGGERRSAGGSSGGCSIASDRSFGSGAVSGGLFLVLTVLLLAVFKKGRTEKRHA